LVHWNSSNYANCGEAAGHPDGLAVLGILLKVGAMNPEFQKIVDLIPNIPHCGEKAALRKTIDPTKMLPKTFSYWTYPGSLTTPPCTESVTWILFKEPVEVSEDQLAAFRRMRYYKRGKERPSDEFDGLIINNYRPPLPLGNREVTEYNHSDYTNLELVKMHLCELF
jgi:carbonic anhydrase